MVARHQLTLDRRRNFGLVKRAHAGDTSQCPGRYVCAACASTRFWRWRCLTCGWRGQWADGAVRVQAQAADRAAHQHAQLPIDGTPVQAGAHL